jgi:hypothetical protein
MIAGGENVGAKVEKLIGYAWGHAETTGRILGVYDDEIDIALFYERTKVFANDTPSRLAKDVTDKKNTQKQSSMDG